MEQRQSQMRVLLVTLTLIFSSFQAQADSKSCWRRIFGWYEPSVRLVLDESQCNAYHARPDNKDEPVDVVSQAQTRMASVCSKHGGYFLPSGLVSSCLKENSGFEYSPAGGIILLFVEGICSVSVPVDTNCEDVSGLNLGTFR